MPVLVTCPSCRARLTVPDDLAGKAVRCSQCGVGMQIPAAPDASSWLDDHIGANQPPPAPRFPAPQKAPQPPRPPSAPAGVKPSRTPEKPEKPTISERPKKPEKPAKSEPAEPGKSLDELALPGPIRSRLEKDIGDEKIVWMGRPSAEERLRQAKPGPIIGGIMLLLMPGSLGLLLLDDDPEKRMVWLAIAGILSAALLMFALPMLFMPLLVRVFMNYRPVYVLTTERALVYHNVLMFMGKVFAYGREELASMGVSEEEGGLGSIVMGYEEYQHQGRFTHKEDVRTSEDGRRKSVTTTFERKGGHTSQIPVGFLDVDEVRKVEAIIRRTMRLPPAKS